MKPNPRRFDLGLYPYHVQIETRFADVDPLWHVNNVKIAEYYQEARVSFHNALRDEIDLKRVADSHTVVAHQSIDYLQEVKYPGAVMLGVGVGHVGNTSYSVLQAMFQHDRCVGLGTTVLVYAIGGSPGALPDRWREVLQKKLIPQDAR